jgi:hypothetical protein
MENLTRLWSDYYDITRLKAERDCPAFESCGVIVLFSIGPVQKRPANPTIPIKYERQMNVLLPIKK